ncbi:MAG: 7,8-dihydro-8-oxoguanine triphosphatase [Parcubacteria group bacterium Gr01-1014_29]|nr:MAG: 7,8-dihydro-8-oxoguanine triphosphatase [Parcubacteria group bacterium Gr01-1014_29]
MSNAQKKILTLCLVYTKDKILLGMKKRGFGMGRWNGFGGKIEKGESIADAAKRELQEEAGIVPHDLQRRGILNFTFMGDPVLLEVHVFSANSFSGEPAESNEMSPQWFSHADIPYDAMWPDDQYWLPKVLAGKNIEGIFHFKDIHTILKHEIREV